MRGNRTTKMNAENFNAFRSFNYPVLASAGIHIKYNNVQIHTHGTPHELEPHYLLDTNIAILKLFPGIQENTADSVVLSYPQTTPAWQKKLGTPIDGTVSSPSAMVKKLQKWCNQK